MPFPQVLAFSGDAKTVRLVGHRGARGLLPENSMIGFDFTLSIGINLLEFDVFLSRDNVPVITHNYRLQPSATRGPNGRFISGQGPRVSSLLVEEIESYDVGRLDGNTSYGQRFPDQAQLDGIKIPKLVDLLHLLSQPKYESVCMMLELKSDPNLMDNRVSRQRFVSVVDETLRSAGMTQRALLHSFDWGLLAECKKQIPDMPLSFLTQLKENGLSVGEDSSANLSPGLNKAGVSIPDEVSRAGGSLWCPHFSEINRSDLARARDLGLCVGVWTVNEPQDIEAMISLGVDSIVTDYPGRAQKILLDLGYRW